MNKAGMLKSVNILLFASFAAQVTTVIAIVFLKDIISKAGMAKFIFELHEYNGYILVALVFVHLYLNWGWVRANILRGK